MVASLGPPQLGEEKPDRRGELLNIAARMRALGIQLLVIDTESKFLSRGLAKELARIAGGKYYYLPKATDKTIAAMAKGAIT